MKEMKQTRKSERSKYRNHNRAMIERNWRLPQSSKELSTTWRDDQEVKWKKVSIGSKSQNEAATEDHGKLKKKAQLRDSIGKSQRKK